MPENTDYSDDQDGDEDQYGEPRISASDLRQLRKQAKQASRLAPLERELAFMKAGIDVSDKRMGYFVKGYDGEMTPEAVRAAAEEAGFLLPATGAVSADEIRSHQRMQQASAGATGEPPFDLSEAIANAQSADEVMAIAQKAGLPTSWDSQ